MEYTDVTDPNKLLGRPGQYTSKANFVDSRVGTDAASSPSVRNGGSVEVFSATGLATTRYKYVKSITSAAALFAEYTCQHGNVILRLSHDLTPEQARAYDAAMRKVLKNLTKTRYQACPW